MFSTLGLFNNVPCPASACALPACIFNHARPNLLDSSRQATVVEEHEERDSKRRKISANNHTDNQSIAPLAAVEESKSVKRISGSDQNARNGKLVEPQEERRRVSMPTKRPISPPDVKRRNPPEQANLVTPLKKAAAPEPPTNAPETLNPRMMLKPPAAHSNRLAYVKKLHEFLTRLNDQAGKSHDPTVKKLKLNGQQLIKLTLDEEEEVARKYPTTYANMIKHRMLAVSRMTVEQWKRERLQAQGKTNDNVDDAAKKEMQLSTGLSLNEEMQILPELFANQKGLERHGYVTVPPTDRDVVDTRAAVELCLGYEQCDRCSSRFQVFRERREDGALTSGGKCTYHHGKMAATERYEGQPSGPRERRLTCCGEALGDTTGCTTSDTHVFKTSDANRLAAVLQFQRTPKDTDIPRHRAVAFDCEMGYTVHGMELIRLTAVSWPGNEELLDVLVKPLGPVLDLNSRFSGVTTEDLNKALPIRPELEESDLKLAKETGRLPLVESPLAARDMLFDLIGPSTPLIGHAIENDLNATRIVHPSIIDTVLLYPHQAGLPIRRALRTLTKEFLGRSIQVAGAAGHDSKEDAIAAGDLVRLAVGKKWKKMQREGYKFEKGKLVAPPQKAGVASFASRARQDIKEMSQAKESEAKQPAINDADAMDWWA